MTTPEKPSHTPYTALGRNKTTEVVHFYLVGPKGRVAAYVANKDDAVLFAAAPQLRAALECVLPYMEAAETAGLVGDEGCHWPVEKVRTALALANEETE